MKKQQLREILKEREKENCVVIEDNTIKYIVPKKNKRNFFKFLKFKKVDK